MTYLLFTTALALSAVAAYYSIMGLVAIFSAAVIPIMVMGTLLEASKLVVASWLYRSWKDVPILMKSYFTGALIVLMFLTSMGIFGYLSKAHLDQAVPSGDIQAKLLLIDEKINVQKENINAARKELNQLDSQIDKYTEVGSVSKGVTVRRQQQADRKRALDEIGAAQAQIAKLREERAPIASEVRKVEAEVGPIKYIADLIYGEEAKNEGFLEKAVRVVILLIVAVFDPLAVLMLVAANWQMRVEGRFGKKPVTETIQEVQEEVSVQEEIKVNVTETDSVSENHLFSASSPVAVTDKVDIKLNGKPWEPELFKRKNALQGSISGAALREDAALKKAQNFIEKATEISNEPSSMKVREFEEDDGVIIDVDGLQK